MRSSIGLKECLKSGNIAQRLLREQRLRDLRFHGFSLQRQARYLVLNEDAGKAGVDEPIYSTLYVQSIAETGVSISNYWKRLSGL